MKNWFFPPFLSSAKIILRYGTLQFSVQFFFSVQLLDDSSWWKVVRMDPYKAIIEVPVVPIVELEKSITIWRKSVSG